MEKINNATNFQKVSLGIAGLTALGIGLVILIAPQAFYASSGIVLTSEPSMLSELRALAANLSVLGIIMLLGVVRGDWIHLSSVAALVVFLAFPAGRTISLIVDGMPTGNILIALTIEVAIGVLCLAAFRTIQRTQITSRTNSSHV